MGRKSGIGAGAAKLFVRLRERGIHPALCFLIVVGVIGGISLLYYACKWFLTAEDDDTDYRPPMNISSPIMNEAPTSNGHSPEAVPLAPRAAQEIDV